MKGEIPIVGSVQVQAQTNEQLLPGYQQGPFSGPKLQGGVVVVVDDNIDFEDSDDSGLGQDRLELQYQADLFF